jgi:integrase/recombinase XerD
MPAAEEGSRSTPAPASSSLDGQLDRYLRHLVVERGLSANTVAAYRRDLGGYLEFLGQRGVTEPGLIGPEDVSAFVASLRTRESGALTASSTARMLSSVRGFHRYLLDEGLVDTDVAADSKPPKLPSRLPKAISIEQMASVLDAAKGETPQALRDAALLELLYATGARISEAVDLNVDDVIDTDQGGGEVVNGDVVRLFGKGGKQRIVPLGSYARAAIDAYLVRARPLFSARGTATPALFLGARGQRMSRQNAWLVIRAVADRANLGIEISPHTFRHSFATHLLAGGADVRVVQELLGHSSVATTQIYTLVTADTLRDMYTSAHPRAH